MWVAAIRRLGRDQSHLGHTAGSVVQDLMRRLIQKGAVVQADNVEAYLVVAVKNLATDVLRQETRRQRDRLADEVETEEDPWDEPSAEDVAEAATDAVIRDQTEAVLATIEEGPRRAFVDRVMRGRPFTEIGREMGISDVQAGRLYRQALNGIRKQLGVNSGSTD
jgi:RNA polymerase sigma factor (sigma-70 family)